MNSKIRKGDIQVFGNTRGGDITREVRGMAIQREKKKGEAEH